MAQKTLNPEALEMVAHTFKVLAEPVRLQILQELRRGEKNVSELCAVISTSQPNISKHLKVLSGGGLVQKQQAGNTVFYQIGDKMVFQLCDLVCSGIQKQLDRQMKIFSQPPKRTKKTKTKHLRKVS